MHLVESVCPFVCFSVLSCLTLEEQSMGLEVLTYNVIDCVF